MRKANRLKAVGVALCAGFLAAVSVSGPSSAADQTARWTRSPGEIPEGPRPDLGQACHDALASPVCALKTYLACVLYDAPGLCAAVGLNGVPERYAGGDTQDVAVLTVPWMLTFERLLPEAFAWHIYDGGLIPPSRFANLRMTGKDGKPKPATDVVNAKAGIYELLIDIPEPYVKDLVYSLSFFFRKDEHGWRMVAWSSSRAKACDTGFGTATWTPCRWFVKGLPLRDVLADDVNQLWASPKPAERDDYPYPGIEIMSGLPNQPVVAPFGGTVLRRCLRSPDMPLYDWVVVQGEGREANMTLKMAFVDRTGAGPGDHIGRAEVLGKPQWIENEHPGAGRFVHMELLRDGQQIDPRTVMRERRAAE